MTEKERKYLRKQAELLKSYADSLFESLKRSIKVRIKRGYINKNETTDLLKAFNQAYSSDKSETWKSKGSQ